MKSILCFGDSNTYGYKPDGSGRFDKEIRWTGLLQKLLGQEEYIVIEEGLCGRTTVFEDDMRPGRRGIDTVSVALESHNPLDYVIFMLGTNDCKIKYHPSPERIGRGMEEILKAARTYTSPRTKILLISPIHLGRGVGAPGYDLEFDVQSEIVAKKLVYEYEKLAKRYGCLFLDASKAAKPSEIDREHMDEAAHRALAKHVEEKIREAERSINYNNPVFCGSFLSESLLQ